jgi:hypothetical protein
MDFEVAGSAYRSDKLDAKRQFHLARRLAPVISKIPGVPEAQLFEVIAGEISSMSDENCDYILDTCLSVVKRQQAGDLWVPVFNARANRMQFEDIDMGAMLQIARHVLEENLQSFFLGQAAKDMLPKTLAT